MNAERRRTTRYAVVVQIEVDGGSGITANCCDDGVYFETAGTLSVDQEIVLVVPFEHAAPGTRASCTARVLRVDRLPRGYGVAAMYETVAFHVS